MTERQPGALIAAGSLAAFALVLTGACDGGGSTGSGGSTGDSGVGGSSANGVNGCGATAEGFAVAACGVCAEEACCAELLACDSGTDCAELIVCADGCAGDATCSSACDDGHPNGTGPRDDLDACLASSCAAPCASPAGICGTDFTTSIAACDECVGGACCAPFGDCISDPTCAACLEDPSGGSCDGLSLLAEVEDCFTQSCSTVCDG